MPKSDGIYKDITSSEHNKDLENNSSGNSGNDISIDNIADNVSSHIGILLSSFAISLAIGSSIFGYLGIND